MTNLHIPGRLPQRTPQQPLVWDRNEEARTIHPKREHPPLKIKQTPRLNERKLHKHMPRQNPSMTMRKNLKTTEIAKGKLQNHTSRGVTKKPLNKAKPQVEKVRQEARSMKREKDAKHPFLTKERKNSKQPASAPQRSEKKKQQRAEQQKTQTGRPRNTA